MMIRWVTTRKVPRTEGPNTPARVAQTVDATVAKWIPVSLALLACSVTPARAKLDVRRYEWAPSFAWVSTPVNATVRTYAPITNAELQSFRVPARPPLDVRRYEWTPEQFDIVTRVDTQVRTWIPAFDKGGLTGKRPSLDIRRYDWQVDETAWISGILVAPPSIGQTLPAFQEPGDRTADRAKLDVRSHEWSTSAAPWFAATQVAAPPTVEQTAPAWTQAAAFRTPRTRYTYTEFSGGFLTPDDWRTWVPLQDTGGRVAARALLDVREHEWAPSAAGWIQSALTPPTPPTVAQTLPAWETHGQRTPDRARLEVRSYDWLVSEAAWIAATLQAPTPPTVAQTWPAFQTLGARTADRARLDVRRYEWHVKESAWIATIPAPSAPTVAQTVPALQAEQFRTRSVRFQGQFRTQDLQDVFVPDFWVTYVPQQDNGDRTPDRARLDVRRFEWLQAGWLYTASTLPTPPTTAQLRPAIQDKGERTRDRAKLDVRAHEWVSDDTGWIRAVVTGGTSLNAGTPVVTFTAPAATRNAGPLALAATTPVVTFTAPAATATTGGIVRSAGTPLVTFTTPAATRNVGALVLAAGTPIVTFTAPHVTVVGEAPVHHKGPKHRGRARERS
jgi:hypothetical protein